MPGRCVVGGCSNGNDPKRNTSLHNIPCYGDDRTEAKARRKQWVDFVKLKRAKWEPTAASRVCSVHFSNSEDFEAQFSIPGVKRRRELNKGGDWTYSCAEIPQKFVGRGRIIRQKSSPGDVLRVAFL